MRHRNMDELKCDRGLGEFVFPGCMFSGCIFSGCIFPGDVSKHLRPGVWLPLEQPPSPFADSEALLLCQLTELDWLTWVPNYGEFHLRLDCTPLLE